MQSSFIRFIISKVYQGAALAFVTAAVVCFSTGFSTAYAAESVTGLWTTIDDETNTPKSVVYVYEYDNQVYGRIVKLFQNADKRMPKVKGNPTILGSDIIWGMQDTGDKYKNGKILDPKKQKIYNSELWREGDNLIVRGKIGPFGRNQTWEKNTDTSLIPPAPVIPAVPVLK